MKLLTIREAFPPSASSDARRWKVKRKRPDLQFPFRESLPNSQLEVTSVSSKHTPSLLDDSEDKSRLLLRPYRNYYALARAEPLVYTVAVWFNFRVPPPPPPQKKNYSPSS